MRVGVIAGMRTKRQAEDRHPQAKVGSSAPSLHLAQQPARAAPMRSISRPTNPPGDSQLNRTSRAEHIRSARPVAECGQKVVKPDHCRNEGSRKGRYVHSVQFDDIKRQSLAFHRSENLLSIPIRGEEIKALAVSRDIWRLIVKRDLSIRTIVGETPNRGGSFVVSRPQL